MNLKKIGKTLFAIAMFAATHKDEIKAGVKAVKKAVKPKRVSPQPE